MEAEPAQVSQQKQHSQPNQHRRAHRAAFVLLHRGSRIVGTFRPGIVRPVRSHDMPSFPGSHLGVTPRPSARPCILRSTRRWVRRRTRGWRSRSPPCTFAAVLPGAAPPAFCQCWPMFCAAYSTCVPSRSPACSTAAGRCLPAFQNRVQPKRIGNRQSIAARLGRRCRRQKPCRRTRPR